MKLVFGPVHIPARTTVLVRMQAEADFHIKKILNTGDTEDLYIAGMFVGDKPQLPTFENSLHVGAFTNPLMDWSSMDLCPAGTFINFQVQNLSHDESRTWSCEIDEGAL